MLSARLLVAGLVALLPACARHLGPAGDGVHQCGREALCYAQMPAYPLIPLRDRLPDSDREATALRSAARVTGPLHVLTIYEGRHEFGPGRIDAAPSLAQAGKPYDDGRLVRKVGLYFVPTSRPEVGAVIVWARATPTLPALLARLPVTVDFRREVVETYGVPGDVAVIDRRSGIGPTFTIDPNGHVERHEPDSAYIWNQWVDTMYTTCGGGPMTRVPAAWLARKPPRC